MEQAIISGVAHDKSEAKVTIVGVPDRTGIAARIFQAIADNDINVDMIVQNVSAAATGLTDISFTLPKAEGQKATQVLQRIQGEVGFASILYDDTIGKLFLSAQECVRTQALQQPSLPLWLMPASILR